MGEVAWLRGEEKDGAEEEGMFVADGAQDLTRVIQRILREALAN